MAFDGSITSSEKCTRHRGQEAGAQPSGSSAPQRVQRVRGSVAIDMEDSISIGARRLQAARLFLINFRGSRQRNSDLRKRARQVAKLFLNVLRIVV
jgi:hypothetical protein